LAAEVGNATEEAERRALANQAIKLVEIAMELQGVARKDLEDLPEFVNLEEHARYRELVAQLK
jgi:hypothetical protein